MRAPMDCERFRQPTFQQEARTRRLLGLEERCTGGMFVGRFRDQKQRKAIVAMAGSIRAKGIRHLRLAMVGAGMLEDQIRRWIRKIEVPSLRSASRAHGVNYLSIQG